MFFSVTMGLVVERVILAECHERLSCGNGSGRGMSRTRGVPSESRQVKHLLFPVVHGDGS